MRVTLFGAVLAILIAVWVYGDAKKRQLKEPMAWAVICLLLSIFGLAGYLIWIVVPNKRKV